MKHLGNYHIYTFSNTQNKKFCSTFFKNHCVCVQGRNKIHALKKNIQALSCKDLPLSQIKKNTLTEIYFFHLLNSKSFLIHGFL
jgi:hypothetical protein